jgi:chemotaxis protein MotB
MDGQRPIIIIKKKASHDGHHGGAWKVAYADFVTAMMALFIVLWLLNTSKPVRNRSPDIFAILRERPENSAPAARDQEKNSFQLHCPLRTWAN